ncbi:MAG: hypothetical protein KDB68_06275 [Planctomycetes bacterium]|nr:hypothetical protein [Planctomycetota bacterium]
MDKSGNLLELLIAERSSLDGGDNFWRDSSEEEIQETVSPQEFYRRAAIVGDAVNSHWTWLQIARLGLSLGLQRFYDLRDQQDLIHARVGGSLRGLLQTWIARRMRVEPSKVGTQREPEDCDLLDSCRVTQQVIHRLLPHLEHTLELNVSQARVHRKKAKVAKERLRALQDEVTKDIIQLQNAKSRLRELREAGPKKKDQSWRINPREKRS